MGTVSDDRATGRRERQVIRSQTRRDLRFTDGGTRPDAPLLRPTRPRRRPDTRPGKGIKNLEDLSLQFG